MTILWIALYFIIPAVILFLTKRFPVLEKIGIIILTYAVGIILGNIGVLPHAESFAEVQDLLSTVMIVLALPLIFFSFDLRQAKRLARPAALALTGGLISIVIASMLGYFLFRGKMGEETWMYSGMIIGVYSGGTPNLGAIKTGLGASDSAYIALNAADIVISTLLIFFIMTGMKPLFSKFLKPFTAESRSDIDNGEAEYHGYFTHFRFKEHFGPLAAAFLIALLIAGAGASITLVLEGAIGMALAILAITTLSLAVSFSPKIRKIRFTFQTGFYLILVFSLVVSSMANIKELISTAPVFILYIAFVILTTLTLHLILSRLFKVDVDSHIITSVSLIYSPPFVPMVAASLKNKEVIVTGIMTGIVGWVLGNYLGIGIGFLLQSLG